VWNYSVTMDVISGLAKGVVVVMTSPALIIHGVYRNKCTKRIPFPTEIEDAAMTPEV